MRSAFALMCPVVLLCPVVRNRVLAVLNDDVCLGLSSVILYAVGRVGCLGYPLSVCMSCGAFLLVLAFCFVVQ